MDHSGATPRPRRSVRDWAVDIAIFLLAVVFGLFLAEQRLAALPEPAWLYDVDQVVGVLGCAALWLRRRWPVHLAVALLAVSTFSELVAGAMLASLFTVAVHRAPRTSGCVFGLSVVSATCYLVLRPEEPPLLLLALGVAMQGAAVGWGLAVRRQRQLVVRAQEEARLRAEQAQMEARETVAREMHDVLGHRLSLLSVHAGALEFRPDAPAEDVARTARVIRESAHQALQDLREVIGVLRAPVGELPQPTVADVPDLVAESRRAGMRVDLRHEIDVAVPETAGRTAYRVVQEALTNARKHAHGAQVRVAVTGAAGTGLAVEVVNDSPAGPRPAGEPGQGITGLTERVALAGGRLEHGPTGTGGWRLAAWLPWPA
ncbi:sensor histidine kinase [Pseudonocardia sp. MH-G8]|uniref:sensor histidine kinase n=1 Tax=Pseudonocardia sp. MH-G8 TaxID=1854588 RepID=UPI000BA1445A|nr:histidine kinase [Pseudonocardia sp. MH-G8]OZM82486.1 sensor histidine kinase [Pseudonocardia sp. MH-G8]